jgi:hypothetical protein
MIGLEEAKEIIRRADSLGFPDQEHSEVQTAAVYEEGWEPLGEDYFYNESSNLIAGPGGASLTRKLTRLDVLIDRKRESSEAAFDISQEWDRQVDLEPQPAKGITPEQGGLTSGDYADWRRRIANGKCTCDS